MGVRAEGAVVALAAVVVAALVAAATLLVPAPPDRMALPTAAELMALEPYLEPADGTDDARVMVPPRVVIDGNPFTAPRTAGSGDETVLRPRPGASTARWVVTAIMIAGAKRIAIVNDRLVRPGDRFGDGARVAAVERDHVVLITPAGERRRLELER